MKPTGRRVDRRNASRILSAAALAGICASPGACASPPPAWPTDAGTPAIAGLCLSAFLVWDPDGGAQRAVEMEHYPPFREIRSDFLWSRIEQQPGTYDFSALDPAVSALQAQGYRPLGILDYDNPLYEGPDGGALDGGPNDYGVSDPSHYAAFAAATAAHYGPSVDYELWNEPNNAFRFWVTPGPAGSNPDPAAYAKLVAAAAPAIAAVCPACRVFGGSIDFQGQERGDLFLEGMLQAEPTLFRAMGALSYHAYPDYVPVAAPDFAGLSPSATADDPEVPLVQMAAKLRSEIANAGGPADFPLAMTEVGWPTGPQWNSPDQQANDLVRASLLSYSTGALVSCLFTLRDGTNAADPESEFGVYANDWTPKPAVTALAVLAQSLGDAAFEKDRGAELGLTSQEHALSFLGPDRRVTALWSDMVSRTVPVPTHGGVSAISLATLDGGTSPLAPEGDTVSVTLDAFPRLLIEQK
ncbi:MAG: glycoside hydrolase 5 family protein [Myxococcales bacterium]